MGWYRSVWILRKTEESSEIYGFATRLIPIFMNCMHIGEKDK
jgi:hypothetical protein